MLRMDSIKGVIETIDSGPIAPLLPSLAWNTTTLLSAEPGCGKSTLSLQLACFLSLKYRVCFASLEMHRTIAKGIYDRIQCPSDMLYVSEENDIDALLSEVDNMQVLVIDSLQKVTTKRPIAKQLSEYGMDRLCQWAHDKKRVCWVISQLNKDGQYAGTRGIEHAVDAAISLTKEKASLTKCRWHNIATIDYALTDKGATFING